MIQKIRTAKHRLGLTATADLARRLGVSPQSLRTAAAGGRPLHSDAVALLDYLAGEISQEALRKSVSKTTDFLFQIFNT